MKENSALDTFALVFFIPLAIFYGLLLVVCLPFEFICKLCGIRLGISQEILDIIKNGKIERQFVYAVLRIINVLAVYCTFMYWYKLDGSVPDKIKAFLVMLFVLGIVLFGMILLDKVLLKKMGILPCFMTTARKMDGLAFESYCAFLLRTNGYRKITVTRASKDQGVDILAYRKGENYAVQCKYYGRPIGNKAVQEVYAGKAYYGCDKAMVMSNNSFTKSAKELGESLAVKLWGDIPIINYSRGIETFWYIVDAVISFLMLRFLTLNVSNIKGIIVTILCIIYTVCFIYEVVRFMSLDNLPADYDCDDDPELFVENVKSNECNESESEVEIDELKDAWDGDYEDDDD